MHRLAVRLLLPGAGILVPVAVGFALVPARSWLGTANVALVLVLVVVGGAATGQRGVAIATAVSAALTFGVLHTEPYGEFSIARREEVITFVCVLVVGLCVAEVATWGRRQRSTAERTVSDVAILRSMSELVAMGEEPDYVVMTAAFWLRELLQVEDCRLELGAGVHGRSRLTTSGEVVLGPVRWDTQQGLPAAEIELEVRGGGEAIGHFVLTPGAPTRVDPDRLLTAVAIADQVGACLAGGSPTPGPDR